MPDADGHPEVEEMRFGDVLAALADPHRRSVVAELLDQPEGTERTCASFGLPVSKSTLTYHFRVLREAGLIRQVNRGNSRKVTLRGADVDQRFPGLLQMVRDEAP
ncbi:ArsR/SmtB family transcription factor [Actinoallomurus soli]|uniref:ArsR/SmtB family transcription factor n=1 Tax=Actinoallomurus soli TaxID=2952535 RepID=UPI0020932CAC|nr:helix-turn-helix domain-containing protein [Actinoallomurus soli]MCO5968059.1 helix-turn-helix domain-containing protein [Actinoallomurus soli]